jgi:WD40 repeat protein
MMPSPFSPAKILSITDQANFQHSLMYAKDNLDSLPNELLLHIFSFLSVKDSSVAHRVNTKWYQLFSEKMHWRHLFKKNFPHLYSLSEKLEIHPKDQLAAQANIKAGRVQRILHIGGKRNDLGSGYLLCSADGQLVATLNYFDHFGYKPCIWEVKAGKLLYTLENFQKKKVLIAFSPNNEWIATGSDDHTPFIWNIKTGEFLRALKGHKQDITTLVFSSNSQLIATSSADHAARIWRVETGECLHTLQGHLLSVTSLAFSPDDKLIVTASDDHTVRLWEIESGKCIWELEELQPVVRVAFSPNGRWIVTNTAPPTYLQMEADGFIKLWNARTGAYKHTFGKNLAQNANFLFSPDGKWLVVNEYDDHSICLWEVETGKCMHTWAGLIGNSYVAFSPDSNLIAIAIGVYDKNVHFWEIETGTYLYTLPIDVFYCASIKFSPNAGHFFVNNQMFDFFPQEEAILPSNRG